MPHENCLANQTQCVFLVVRSHTYTRKNSDWMRVAQFEVKLYPIAMKFHWSARES
jgi:hypothetical protein